MSNSLNRKFIILNDIKFILQSVSGICLGLFLFLLFFLPLNPLIPDFNNKILVLCVFVLITFVLLIILRIFIPSIFPNLFNPQKWTLLREILLDILFVGLNTVAYSFFARYVGRIEITFHLIVNIVFISLTPIAILIVLTNFSFLRKNIRNSVPEKLSELPAVSADEFPVLEFETENRTGHFYISPDQIILINAASNYIEIIFKKNGKTGRQLIRNSLKNTEKLLSNYPFFIRCHRSYIVNKNKIQKTIKAQEGLKLVLDDYPHEINISRKYFLKVKESLQMEG